jgi:phosphoribosylformylglycinamidine synthase
VKDQLLAHLSHPNIASKHWIIRQYDHEVQGGSVIKPLIGPQQIGPSDAAVIRPKLDSTKGVAIGCGLVPNVDDPYAMAIASIDEAIRNVVAVGADPAKTAILDNFCWPSVDDERTMGTLVRACEACRDAAMAYRIPFISGKDSLHNQFTNQETGKVIRIPNTLLISAISVIDDVRRCVTMDLKDPREGHIALISAKPGAGLKELAAAHRAMADAIGKELIISCHDVSDGGWLTAAAEMCIAGNLGMKIDAARDDYFTESPGRYLVEIHGQGINQLQTLIHNHGVEMTLIGRTSADSTPALQVSHLQANRSERIGCHVFVKDLTQAWRGTLDW